MAPPATAVKGDDVDPLVKSLDDVDGLNDCNSDGLADFTLQTPTNVTFGIQV